MEGKSEPGNRSFLTAGRCPRAGPKTQHHRTATVCDTGQAVQRRQLFQFDVGRVKSLRALSQEAKRFVGCWRPVNKYSEPRRLSSTKELVCRAGQVW